MRPAGVHARARRRRLGLCGTPVAAAAHQHYEQRGPDRCKRQHPDPWEVRGRRGAGLRGDGRDRLDKADTHLDRLRRFAADVDAVALHVQRRGPRALVRERDAAVADSVQIGPRGTDAQRAARCALELDERVDPNHRSGPATRVTRLAHRDDGELEALADLSGRWVLLVDDAGLRVSDHGERRDGQDGDENGCFAHARVHRSRLSGSWRCRNTPTLNLGSRLYSPIPMAEEDLAYDSFPDLGALSDEELKQLIQRHTEEEQEVSYRRRILPGKIDILRAELVNRLRKKHQEGESVITGADVQQLTDILSGKSVPDVDVD